MPSTHPPDRPALLIIDMVKDYFDPARPLPVTALAEEIIAPINRLSEQFRQNGWPVIFATDSFTPQDFFFQGKMTPHALAGTPGAEIVDALTRTPDDLWLPKPRMSAFFGTDLDCRLLDMAVTLCAVAGIATPYCVLTTVLDALCHGFKSVLLTDCSAAASHEMHRQTIDIYRRNPLFPLLRTMTADELVADQVPAPPQQEE